MNSFILHFKPWIIAFIVILLIEGSVFIIKEPKRFERNSFLSCTFGIGDRFQRLCTYEKIENFGELEDNTPTILQVGDSSGFHAAQPPVIESYLPGYRYINMNVATTLGYSGSYSIAKYMIERNKNIKYLVVYTTWLGSHPRKSLWWGGEELMDTSLHNEFLDPLHRLFQIPSLSSREYIINSTIYFGEKFKEWKKFRDHSDAYRMAHLTIPLTGGWSRETDNAGDIITPLWDNLLSARDSIKNKNMPPKIRAMFNRLFPCREEFIFDWTTFSNRSVPEMIISEFKQLADKHGIKLIFIVNPIPESTFSKLGSENIIFDFKSLQNIFTKINKMYPDIYMPKKFEAWPDERFSVFSHIATPYSHLSSERIALILKNIVDPIRNPIYKHNNKISDEIIFGETICSYAMTDPFIHNGIKVRQMNPGRNQCLLYFYTSSDKDQKYRLYFTNDSNQNLVKNIFLSSWNIPINSTISEDEHGLFLEFILNKEITQKYDGWINKASFFIRKINRMEQKYSRRKKTSA